MTGVLVYCAVIFGVALGAGWVMSVERHHPNLRSLRQALVTDLCSSWQLETRKRRTLCQCCAYRVRPFCKGVGGELEHSWAVTHGWLFVFVRCWHCDYKCKVGTRRRIKNVEAALVAHVEVLEAVKVYEAAREFEEYREMLQKRYR